MRAGDHLIVPAARILRPVSQHLIQRKLPFRQLLVPQLTLLNRHGVSAPGLWRRSSLRARPRNHVENGTALSQLVAHVVAHERRRTLTAQAHDDNGRTPVLVLHLFRRLVDRFHELRSAGLPAARSEPLERRAQLGAIVREVHDLLRLHDDGVQGELGMAKKLLHESGGAQLKGAGSLVRHEQRDSERNLCRRDADDVARFAAVLDLEVGGLHVGDGRAVLVGG